MSMKVYTIFKLIKVLCRNMHEQSVRTQIMKIAQNESFFVGSKD
jgi:hypothetical protein